MTSDHDDIQELLAAVSAGDREARKKLFAVLYRDLHALAHEAMRKERADHVLQTTALVHETYMRLIKGKEIQWRSRADFFSMAARAMRYILVDEARSRRAAKRGKGQPPLPLYEVGEAGGQASAAPEPAGDLEQLDEALTKLAARAGQERRITIVELRFFVGMTLEETAEILGVSVATVKRDWEQTREWLRQEIKNPDSGS